MFSFLAKIRRLEISESQLKKKNEDLTKEAKFAESANSSAKAKLESLFDDVKQLKANVKKSETEKMILQNQVDELKNQTDENNNR